MAHHPTKTLGVEAFTFIGVMVAFWTHGSGYGNSTAMDAKSVIDFCAFSDLTTENCYDAQRTWDNAIQGAWSFAVLGLVIGTLGMYEIERKDSEGNWPALPSQADAKEEMEPKSKREKPKGSWRNRSTSEEE